MATKVPSIIVPTPVVPGVPSGAGTYYPPHPYAESTPEPTVWDDAISLWRLDEASGTRADSIGSNDLTDNNTVLYSAVGPAAVVGQFAAASSEYLNANPGIGLMTGDYTISAWVNFDGASGYQGTDAGGYFSIIENNQDGAVVCGVLPTGKMQFLWWDAGTLRRIYTNNTFTGWHFVVVRNTSGTKSIWIDGVAQGTTASTTGSGWGDTKTNIGRSYAGVGYYFNSSLSRIGVWNGTAVADSVVTSLYNSGRGKAYGAMAGAELTGLTSFWNLDEASGNRADSHGSNTLTDNNTVGSATNSYPVNLPGTVASFVAANNERLSHADDATLKFGTGDFTFSGWINPTSFAGTNSIIDKGVQQDYTLDANGGNLRFYSANGGGYPIASVAQPSTGAWHHVVVWRSSADSKWYIQLDGGTPGEASAVIVSSDTTGAFTLGGLGATNFYNGLMSSVALWSRVLTADERTALYNSGDGAVLP